MQAYVHGQVTIGRPGVSKWDIGHKQKRRVFSITKRTCFIMVLLSTRTHRCESEISRDAGETFSLNSNRLRPCCLARYRAASAWDSSPSRSVGTPWWRPATPKLAVTLSEGANSRRSSANPHLSRSSATVTPCLSMWLNARTNSSPPRRAQMFDALVFCRSTVENLLSTSSPAACP